MEDNNLTQRNQQPNEADYERQTIQTERVPPPAVEIVSPDANTVQAASLAGPAVATGKKKRRIPSWAWPVGLLGGFVGFIACGALAFLVFSQLAGPGALIFRDVDLPTATPNATPNPDFFAQPIPGWDGDRITILLLGADTRSGETNTRPLTDSIILLMIDPEEKIASVLSIPRDLYMEVPGYGLNRINTAYPLGGGDLTKQTIEYNFGIQVDYFVLINFDAFVRFIDEIGGIEVNVPVAVYDELYPATCPTRSDCGYDPFYIEAGLQTLDGETALKYARTRKADSDFERAERQQLILFAIRDKVLSPGNFTTYIRQAPELYNVLSSGIVTDLTLNQMIGIANAAQQIDSSDIRSGVLGRDALSGYRTPGGADVLVADRTRLNEILYYVFWQECLEGGCPNGQE